MRCNKRVVSLTLGGTEGSKQYFGGVDSGTEGVSRIVIKNGIPPSNSINISPFSHSSIRELESVEYGPKCD